MSSMDSRKSLEPVLMLVPYFPPQTHAAMFRAHKLAKYLPQLGYRPVVVTADINYLYNEDPALLDELPAEVEIHRARHIEPTLRGLRMALGGRDRTFAALKRSSTLGNPQAGKTTAPQPGRPARSWSAELVRIFGEWPDRYWTWSLDALRVCRRLIAEQNIRLLYTSAVPVSPLATAISLQREFGMKWVADFRDPVGYGKKHSADGIVASAIEGHILSGAMKRADLVTGLADSYGNIFFDLYDLPESRYRFIPTGLDESYLKQETAVARDPGMLLHVGEVMPNQSRHTFAVLARAHALAPAAMSGLRLVFVGRREINAPRVAALTGSIPDWPYHVEFIDHVPQSEVYALIQRARACLLIPGRRRYWWTNFAKLVDYLALGVPVIADVPPVSEVREELGKAGNGFFLQGEDVDADARALISWLSEGAIAGVTDYGQRYTAVRQAQAFAAVFDEVLAGGPTR